MSIEPNHRFIRALMGLPVDCRPVWLMRQAGRYLPEYQAVRKKCGSFMGLCKSPVDVAEVTIQPLERFDLDAAIIFSDILVIPEALGVDVHFEEGVGPILSPTVDGLPSAELEGLSDEIICQRLSYVFEGIERTKERLGDHRPLIGFSGSPWTLLTYLCEGGSSKDFKKVKSLIMAQPEVAHAWLRLITRAIIAYLKEKVSAGVDTVMIFDSWGGLLSPHDYQTFSYPYIQEITQQLSDLAGKNGQPIPRIVFAKGGYANAHLLAQLNCEAIGVDWTASLGQWRQALGPEKTIQGNMDPFALFGSKARIQQDVEAMLNSHPSSLKHVVNLGHGIHRHTPPEHVKWFVDLVHELSKTSQEQTTETLTDLT